MRKTFPRPGLRAFLSQPWCWRNLAHPMPRVFMYFSLQGREISSSTIQTRRSTCGIVDVRWLPHGLVSLDGERRMRESSSIAPNSDRDKRPRSVRCPYCVEGREFRLMLDHDSDECYLCASCGHLAMPGHPEFSCPCTKCFALNLRSRARPC